MRTWIMLCLAALTAINAQAMPVIASGLGEWKFSPVRPMSLEHEFTQGAEAILTFAQNEENGPRISVFLFNRAKPSDLALSGDKTLWHNFIFAKLNAHKISVVNERVVLRNGQWRYFVEYLADDGGQTMVHCVAMAQVVGDEVKLLTYQHENAIFLANYKDVAKLFRGIELRADH